MAKITIEFDTENLDDVEMHRSMLRHRDYFCAIWEIIHTVIRKEWKYAEHDHQETWDVIERIKEGVWGALSENNVGEEF